MLGENLKELRKKRGMSQEQLALRLHVVRQTVSKWEKGLSVPDAETLMQISEIFNVSSSALLGETVKEDARIGEVAEQLSNLNELLAMQMQRQEKTRKGIKTVVLVIFVIIVIAAIYPSWCDMWHDFGENVYHMLHG